MPERPPRSRDPAARPDDAPKLALVPGWKTVLWRSWANRFAALSILLYAAEQALPLFQFLPHEARQFLPPWFFGALPAVTMALTILARVIRQRRLDDAQKR